MYKEFGVSRARHRGFHGGAEVREAESPLLGGDRPHCGACWFLEIKTGPGTARLFGGWCPPTPTAIPKSFHPVPSRCRTILVNIPSLKRRKN